MKFEHYLFDLDGTVVSTKEIHQKSFNQALVELGLPPVQDIDLHLYEAMPSFDKIKKYNIINDQHVDIEQFLLVKDRYSEINIENCDDLFDQDLVNAFSYLRKLDKRVSICSNCSEGSLVKILTKAGILQFVDYYYHNKSCKPKPSPEMYRIAIARSKIPARNSIIFEDSDKGLVSALQSDPEVSVVRVFDPRSLKLFFN